MVEFIIGAILLIGAVVAWFVLGFALGYPILRIREFDGWRHRTSNGAFNRRFRDGDPDFGVFLFWPAGLLILPYHLYEVHWDKDQRRMWRQTKKDEKLLADSKKQEALHTLSENCERERERKLRKLEEKAGIDT